MVRALVAILSFLRSAWLLEAAGAGLVVAGVAVEWGTGPALIAGGVCAALKSFELGAPE